MTGSFTVPAAQGDVLGVQVGHDGLGHQAPFEHAGYGQLWKHRHLDNSGDRLVLVHEPTDPEVLQRPDNLRSAPNTGGRHGRLVRLGAIVVITAKGRSTWVYAQSRPLDSPP